jgi:hypothetical protein
MSERDDRYAPNEVSRTAEFRAAPDISASTAQFKAFASGLDGKNEQGRQGSSWPEQPWAGDTPSRGSGRTTALIVGAIVLVAVIVVIVFAVG